MSIVQNQLVEVRTEPLAVLAAEINQEHAAATAAAVSAIEHARNCGELLIKAKAEIGHGGFQLWLKSNCRVKERQARNYMLLARNWETISKSAPGAEMTVKGALKLIDGGNHDGEQTPTIAELLTCLDDAATEYKALREGLASSETHRAIVDKHITEETLLRFGWDSCYRNVQDELTRVLARKSELRNWFDEVVDASQKRMAELSAIADTEPTTLAANEDYGLPAELPHDQELVGIYLDSGDDMAQIVPAAKHPGYFFVSVVRDQSTAGADIVFTRRPIKMAYVGVALKGLGFGRRAGWGPQPFDGMEPWYIRDGVVAAPFRGASA